MPLQKRVPKIKKPTIKRKPATKVQINETKVRKIFLGFKIKPEAVNILLSKKVTPPTEVLKIAKSLNKRQWAAIKGVYSAIQENALENNGQHPYVNIEELIQIRNALAYGFIK